MRLPMICRGNGHVERRSGQWESTASAVRKRRPRAAIPGGWCWRAFCHDASECYMSDVPRPFKTGNAAVPRRYEDHLLSVIYEKYLGSDLTAEEQRMMKQIEQ